MAKWLKTGRLAEFYLSSTSDCVSFLDYVDIILCVCVCRAVINEHKACLLRPGPRALLVEETIGHRCQYVTITVSPSPQTPSYCP